MFASISLWNVDRLSVAGLSDAGPLKVRYLDPENAPVTGISPDDVPGTSDIQFVPAGRQCCFTDRDLRCSHPNQAYGKFLSIIRQNGSQST